MNRGAPSPRPLLPSISGSPVVAPARMAASPTAGASCSPGGLAERRRGSREGSRVFRTWGTLGFTDQHPHTPTPTYVHTSHTYTHAHQALGPTTNTAEREPGRPGRSQRLGARQPAGTTPLSQAGGLGPGPATSYKIKNISNIQ